MEVLMKKLLMIILLSTITLIQSDNSQIQWITNEISRYNSAVSENTTLSDQEVTLEMPDCPEPTYVYLRNNNQYQRILLDPNVDKETVKLIKAPQLSIYIIPKEPVEDYIRCRQENIKLLTKQSEEKTNSEVEDTRPSIKKAKEQFTQGALQECRNLREIFVTNLVTHDAPKHIILPTYKEMLNFQQDQIAKTKEYQAAHPNHGQSMELYIPEQTLKFSIKNNSYDSNFVASKRNA